MGLLTKIHDHIHDSMRPHSHDRPPFWVRNYDRIVRFASLGRTAPLHNGTLTLADLTAGQSVLDVGCGTGEFLLAADRTHADLGDLVGLDPEAGMIAQAQAKARSEASDATFLVGRVESIPYPDNTFDVVTSSLMFHHLSPEQQIDGLVEIFRVLAPAGRLIIVDINPARRSLVTSLPGHRTADPVDSVRERLPLQLRGAGFTVDRTGTHAYKALSYAVATKR